MLIVDRNISFSDYSSAGNSCLAFLFTKDFFPHCSLVLQQSQGHTSFLVLFWILPQWLLCFTDCYHQSHKRAIGHAAFQPFGSREYSVLLSSISICNQCTIFFSTFNLLWVLKGPWLSVKHFLISWVTFESACHQRVLQHRFSFVPKWQKEHLSLHNSLSEISLEEVIFL